ncbi:hypothetical protein Ga0100231_022380 [Opitutaceae bacterium TAV4]|nr:hypothetical protein Ga0100231_022380 [Opitutaceae bacterium TAV4]RRK00617.1 hypothetical protein Ga0100230_022600 [Opitutaceae bacterium TAV3]
MPRPPSSFHTGGFTPPASLLNIIASTVCIMTAPICLPDVIYKPGSLTIEAASGMIPAESQQPDAWHFTATNHDPYTKPVKLPRPHPTKNIKAIAIEFEKTHPVPGDRLELFPVLDNNKNVSTSRRLETRIQTGPHRYLFATDGIRWFTGNLTALRLDPGSSPGNISIKSIAILETLPLPPCARRDILIPVSDDLKPTLGPANDTLKNAPLIRYRLSSESIDFALLAHHAGRSVVLKLHLRNSGSKTSTDTLSFASKRLKPFSPVIPPYAGLHAQTFKISAWTDSPDALANASIQIEKADGSSQTLPLTPPRTPAPASTAAATAVTQRDGWHHFTLDIHTAGQIPAAITGITFVNATLPGTNATLYLAAPALEGQRIKGGIHDLLNMDAPMMLAGMDAPLATQPAHPLPVRDVLILGGYEIHKPDMAASIPAMANFMRENFPQWDFILAPVFPPPLSIAARLPALPNGVFFQFQKAQLTPDYLIATDHMPRNARGAALKDFGNAVLATDPVIQSGLKDEIDYAASLGVNNFKQVDMVWPYEGGRWGYDHASLAAYRDALAGCDEGLALLPGLPSTPGARIAAGGTIHFHDYYEYYHGFRLNPSDLNLKTWDAYTPASERDAARGGFVEKRNLGLFVLLYHYEWLRQAQRFGRWAKAHGGTHTYTLNPEDLGNGGDYIFLVHLADAGTPYIEYFGGPSVLRGAYHNLPIYSLSAAASGRKFGLTLELGQGGHGQHYLAPEINYLYASELAAAGLRNYHNEWVEAPWLRMASPVESYHYDRWSAWVSGALGFTFAREQNVRRPASRVFNISLRSPGYYMNSWLWNVNQSASFGPLLAENHVQYEQWDRSAMPRILDAADVIFFCPPASRAQDWKALRAWLTTGNKSLITHTGVPFNMDDGQARLAADVENVTYRGEDHNYSDFLAEKNNASAASVLFPEFKSLEKFTLLLAATTPDVAAPPAPLLSSLMLSTGSRLYYLHRDPARLDAADRARVFAIIEKQLHLPRSVLTSSAPVMVHRFAIAASPENQNTSVDILNVWSGLDRPGFKGGYGKHLMPDRAAAQFDPQKRPFPYLASDSDFTIETPVREPGSAYRVYAFLSGEENVVHASPSGALRLHVKGALAEQFYFAKDGPGIREKITRLKQHRARLLPYCPDLPRQSLPPP